MAKSKKRKSTVGGREKFPCNDRDDEGNLINGCDGTETIIQGGGREGVIHQGGKTRKSKKKSHKKTKRKMNAFMTMMLDAKKHKKPSFVYKGKKYKQGKTKTGLVIYKKG
ncbi:hypothetical protein N9O88_01415 [bacterium]|nr:hypothetical protein [bacterium]